MQRSLVWKDGVMVSLSEVVVKSELPDSEAAVLIMRRYLSEVVGRYHRRALSAEELDGAAAEFPNDELAPPTGVLLLAWLSDQPVGCAGLRYGPDGIGDVFRVYVEARHRRRGIGIALMRGLEARAREHGLDRLRLDTRDDLTGARGLYAAMGYGVQRRALRRALV